MCANILYLFFYTTFYSFAAKIITHIHMHSQAVVFFSLIETNVKFISDAWLKLKYLNLFFLFKLPDSRALSSIYFKDNVSIM